MQTPGIKSGVLFWNELSLTCEKHCSKINYFPAHTGAPFADKRAMFHVHQNRISTGGEACIGFE